VEQGDKITGDDVTTVFRFEIEIQEKRDVLRKSSKTLKDDCPFKELPSRYRNFRAGI